MMNEIAKHKQKLPQITRTSCPENYLSPIQFEMDLMARRIGIDYYSPLLVKDLAHVAAGGKVLSEDIWIPQLREIVDTTLESPNANGKWHFKHGGSIEYHGNDRNMCVERKTSVYTAYHKRICDFISELKFDEIPGRSPLEKAMNVLTLLAQEQGSEPEQQGKTPYKIFAGDTGDEDGDGSVEAQEGADVAQKIHQRLAEADDIDGVENELLAHLPDNKGSTDAGVGTATDLKRMELATDMGDEKRIWLDVSRTLDTEVKMDVSKSVKMIPDLHGNEMRIRPIDNYGELPKVQAAEYALPQKYRMYRAVTKQSPIRERVRREEKQQLLYMIIDCSGSMGGEKIAKAGGVLMNRLKAVVKGEAQLFCRFFDERLFFEHYAGNPKQAKKLIKKFKAENFSGGGTDISGCAKEAQKRINKLLDKNEVLYRPELVIVTDGEDDVSRMDVSDFEPTRVHSFIVGGRNNDLIDFAKSTGGVGVSL